MTRAAAQGSSSAPLPFLSQPRARAPPLLLGSGRSPFQVTSQPLRAAPRLRICAQPAHRYLGSLLDSLADIAAGRSKPPGPASWALLAVGLAATVAVLVYVSRAATARVAAARLRKPPADADGVP